MFSIVIPLFNKSAYIGKALQSVFSQTFQHYELIVVDDGSTDDGVAKLAAVQDPRLRVIHQPNRGVSSARNTGVAHAASDYVAFLDADDWWDRHFLESMHALICQFPDAGLYGAGYQVVKNGINTPAKVGVPADFEAGYINYFEVYARTFWVPINCSFAVVRKSVFEEMEGFRPALKFGEDLDLWIRIALKYRVGYVRRFLAYSNQDVAASGRALGAGKQWDKSEHVIFNLDYLKEPEGQVPFLKSLLDGLKVRSLVEFYLQSRYQEETRLLLKNVDFSRQPLFYRRVYHWPRRLVLAYFRSMKLGSSTKQALIRHVRKVYSLNEAPI